MLENSRHILLAVFLLAGKVAQGLFPQGGVLLPMALTHQNHLPVLLVLHVVMHDLLEPATGKGHTPQRLSLENHLKLPYPLRVPKLLQLPLLIEVKNSILEVMHLAQDQGLVEHITEPATLQQGDSLCMKFLLGLQEKGF